MKKRLRQRLILAGVFCVTAFGIHGCGNASEQADTEEAADREDPSDKAENGLSDDKSGQDEEQADKKDPGSGSETKEEADGEKDSRKTEQEDLTGDICRIGDGQFTVVESVTEELDDGSLLMAAPAEGADSPEDDQVTVTWDEETVFYIRTIYDNGARYEDAAASAEDLKDDDMVLVWGTWETDHESIHAEQIQIDEFVR